MAYDLDKIKSDFKTFFGEKLDFEKARTKKNEFGGTTTTMLDGQERNKQFSNNINKVQTEIDRIIKENDADNGVEIKKALVDMIPKGWRKEII